MVEYVRPFLYPKQERAFFNPRRFVYCEASTKSGKTVGAIAWILEKAFGGSAGQNFWWVAPISDQAKIAFQRIKNNLTKGTFIAAESPTPKITLLNGTVIWFKSADNPDSLYGEDVYAAVVDEASRCKEDAWYALRSTLTATQGEVRVIGNVKGRKNWFYRQSRLAESGDYDDMDFVKITVVDAIDAGVIPASELEAARRDLPPSVFNELYMAEAADDSGNPFGLDHIRSCVGSLSSKPPVAFGIDLAKKNDWLVVIGLDEDGAVSVFKRWQHVPWRVSIRRIHALVGEDTPALVDSTGVGDPVLEELQVEHGNFTGFHFTAPSKQKLMEGLAVSIQGHELTFPTGPIVNELETFEYEYKPSGVRYTAPEGLHDDCVCALALAREQFTTVAPGANMVKYMINESQRLEVESQIPIGDAFFREMNREINAEMMTWREPLFDSEALDNELTKLYEETVRNHPTNRRTLTCAGCGRPVIGPTKVSDGVFVWHPECARTGLAA